MATGEYVKLPMPPPVDPGFTDGFTAEQELRLRALSRARFILGGGASVWDAISGAEYILTGATATTE